LRCSNALEATLMPLVIFTIRQARAVNFFDQNPNNSSSSAYRTALVKEFQRFRKSHGTVVPVSAPAATAGLRAAPFVIGPGNIRSYNFATPPVSPLVQATTPTDCRLFSEPRSPAAAEEGRLVSSRSLTNLH
jgi:hypothetical protein